MIFIETKNDVYAYDKYLNILGDGKVGEEFHPCNIEMATKNQPLCAHLNADNKDKVLCTSPIKEMREGQQFLAIKTQQYTYLCDTYTGVFGGVENNTNETQSLRFVNLSAIELQQDRDNNMHLEIEVPDVDEPHVSPEIVQIGHPQGVLTIESPSGRYQIDLDCKILQDPAGQFKEIDVVELSTDNETPTGITFPDGTYLEINDASFTFELNSFEKVLDTPEHNERFDMLKNQCHQLNDAMKAVDNSYQTGSLNDIITFSKAAGELQRSTAALMKDLVNEGENKDMLIHLVAKTLKDKSVSAQICNQAFAPNDYQREIGQLER